MQAEESHISSIQKKSFFHKMREATFRPKNYSSFKTVHDSDSRQDGNKKEHDWAASWMRTSQRSRSVHENESERMLKEENDKLKKRLNVANNAIRDLEYVCKKHEDSSERPAPKGLCSLLPKTYRETQNDRIEDDKSFYSSAVNSQAATIQMGSSSANKKCKPSKFKPSCYKSLLFGTKLRKKLALKEMEASNYRTKERTPPCTPERTPKNQNKKKSTMGASDILKDISSSLLGIGNVNHVPLPKEEKRKKLLSINRLISKPSSFGRRRDGGVRYNYDGAYPIDINQANPIDDNDSSDDDQLPVIQESDSTEEFSYDDDDFSRAEI